MTYGRFPFTMCMCTSTNFIVTIYSKLSKKKKKKSISKCVYSPSKIRQTI